MRPLAEAQREVLAAVPTLPTVTVPVMDALGLVLSDPVVAPHDVPPFTNSAMDGYAVIGADVAEVPVTLRVVDDVAAGHVSEASVSPGTAIKIMTGAPVPAGADTVVKVEDTEPGDGSVTILAATKLNAAIRPAGGDLRAGSEVFGAGERLTARHLAVLASLGISPSVRRRPLVAVLSTGDEILPPDADDLSPGQIRDSNRPLIKGLLDELGAEVMDLGIIADDQDALRAALAKAVGEADAIITSGGVSMGEFDIVKLTLRELGTVDFWKVAIQPAKPFGFGNIDGVPIFGLPGNPVSVMVSFEQFARPALLHMMGAKYLFRSLVPAVADEDWRTDPAKTVFTRVTADLVDGVLCTRPSGGQMSNMVTALARADAFAPIPVGVGVVEVGDTVMLELFRSPESRCMSPYLMSEVFDG